VSQSFCAKNEAGGPRNIDSVLVSVQVPWEDGVGAWGVRGTWSLAHMNSKGCVSRSAVTYANFLWPINPSPRNFGAGSGNESSLQQKPVRQVACRRRGGPRSHTSPSTPLPLYSVDTLMCPSISIISILAWMQFYEEPWITLTCYLAYQQQFIYNIRVKRKPWTCSRKTLKRHLHFFLFPDFLDLCPSSVCISVSCCTRMGYDVESLRWFGLTMTPLVRRLPFL
jgi:hypothetical protein